MADPRPDEGAERDEDASGDLVATHDAPAHDATLPATGEQDGAAAVERAATATAKATAFRAVTSGSRLGRYQVLEEIGEGGMATVFRARDPELRRDVAIKVLFPHLSRRREIVQRFHREARAAARLSHPAILQTYDVGGGEGREPPYIVMELVRGASLQDHAATQQPMLAELVACAGAVVAEALAVAHQAGVIHRDLKPANLLVAEDGRLLLADFGVAHVERDESLATRTGAVLGTPAYMSPEQATGEAIDARSDLYSLGATLYHLATGGVPYSGPAIKVMAQLATPGSLVPPLQRRPAVGRAMSSAILELMAQQPAKRPADARAAATALRGQAAALAEKPGEPVDAVAELATYFRGPEAYLAERTPRVVTQLIEQSRRARGDGKLAAALALADRAAALAPDDEAVQQLVREVTSQQGSWRRGWRAGAVAAAVGAAALAAVLLVGRGGAGSEGSAPGAQVVAEGGASPLVGGQPIGSGSPAGQGVRPADSSAEVRKPDSLPDAGSAAAAAAAAGTSSGSGSADAVRVSDRGIVGRGTRGEPGRGSGPAASSANRTTGAGAGSASATTPEMLTTAATAATATTPGTDGSGSSPGSASTGEPSTPPAIAAAAPAMAAATFAMDAWCQLSIDGISHGRADRTKAIALPAGKHQAVCTQGPGLGQWAGELELTAGQTLRVAGELRLEVSVTLEVSGGTVEIDGASFANRQRIPLRNGRHRVVVRDGTRELANKWISIPRVARCTLRDQPELDCYP